MVARLGLRAHKLLYEEIGNIATKSSIRSTYLHLKITILGIFLDLFDESKNNNFELK